MQVAPLPGLGDLRAGTDLGQEANGQVESELPLRTLVGLFSRQLDIQVRGQEEDQD